MTEESQSTAGIDLADLGRCRLHGLLFDRTVTDECPLCEYERAERVARSGHDGR
jgi:hypothetical protein